jgi:hypothetical protein
MEPDHPPDDIDKLVGLRSLIDALALQSQGQDTVPGCRQRRSGCRLRHGPMMPFRPDNRCQVHAGGGTSLDARH